MTQAERHGRARDCVTVSICDENGRANARFAGTGAAADLQRGWLRRPARDCGRSANRSSDNPGFYRHPGGRDADGFANAGATVPDIAARSNAHHRAHPDAPSAGTHGAPDRVAHTDT